MSDRVSYEDLKVPFTAKFLTTSDNPFDPFTQFDAWFQYDTEHGYNTCGLIDRFLPNSRSFDASEQNDEVNAVIDKIVQLDPLNQYIVVVKQIVPEFIEQS